MTESESSLTPIQKFYSGTNIFITGGTGFLGTILIEKLLRSCNDISTIYVLARNKKGKNLETRLDELFDVCVFDLLKKEFPKFRHKIVGISGDCSLPDLGLSLQDRQMLINEVSIVFHVAATVRFNEKLKTAVAINVRGTQEMLKLSNDMKNLKSIVHVSTAYSNVPNKTIEEMFYPSPVDSSKMILLAETIPEHILEKITPTVLDKWPNTYTFTKAIAEDIIRQHEQKLPIAIHRPSIVVSTYREPIRSWINNLYGPSGVATGVGTGVLRSLHGDKNVNANMVPVDMCVNSMIALAWDVAIKFEEEKTKFEIPIYHFESSKDQPITWGEFMNITQLYGFHIPTIKAIWYWSLTFCSNYYIFLIHAFFSHFLPALLVDGAMICMGKSPKMLKIYKKVHTFTGVLSYFTTGTWNFKSERVKEMLQRMSYQDQQIFFCNLKELDWNEYLRFYVKGLRIYLLQDPLDTVELARIRWRRLYWLHQATKLIAAYFVLTIIWWITSRIFFVK